MGLLSGTLLWAQQGAEDKDDSWKKVYRATATKLNDLVDTRLDVKFDYDKSYLYGKAWVTLKPHFYPTDSLALDAMLGAIRKMPAGDVILLHGCCHNPTGIDPTASQWNQIVEAVQERGLLPLVDFAYQGFADGLAEDAAGLHAFCRPGAELLACSSFSKNFSLYRERVGALFALAPSPEAAKAVQTQLDRVVRANYSNPPGHGAEIVSMVLRDRALRQQWEGEVTAMRSRINGMRHALVDALTRHGVPGDFSFITRQRGMFSYSGLKKDQVDALRDEYAIYIVGSGRINVAGLTGQNVDRVAECIGAVVGQPA